jgi:hypothetical protein
MDGGTLVPLLIALTVLSALVSAAWLLDAYGALRRALERRRQGRDRRQRDRPVVTERRFADRRPTDRDRPT